MLNSYSYSANQSIKINAVSGTLVKNYKDSFFLTYELGSSYVRMLHSKDPEFYRVDSEYTKVPVVVIQTMVVGENRVMSEVMYKKDFDKLFEVAGGESES